MMIEPVSVVATGCVTPMGMGGRELRRAVLEGVSPVESRMSLPWRGEEAVYYSLPPEVERELARLPRPAPDLQGDCQEQELVAKTEPGWCGG